MSDAAHLHAALLDLSADEWRSTVQRMSWYCRTRSTHHVPTCVSDVYLPTPEEWPAIRHEARKARRRQAYQGTKAEKLAAQRAAFTAAAKVREQRRNYMRGYMRKRRNQTQS